MNSGSDTGDSHDSDEHIARAAEKALQSAAVARHVIDFKVDQGWITLTGTLNWDYQRRAAVDAVCNLLGVVGVRDEIAITQSALNGNVQTGTTPVTI